ncbi:MAG: hypothetical protein WCK41_09325 [Actinomycetes bacterium]
MSGHPDLEAEQAYIDRAYAYLEASRKAASRMTTMVEVGRGGTEQARFERDVIWETMLTRLTQLELGDASLCFGRIDQAGEPEPYYIGRVAVSNDVQDPIIVDWRAPVAEPFYRATGRQPMGILRRRHFATRGRVLLDLEDELFGEALEGLSRDGNGSRISGHGALMNALETARSGKLGDIVATIQGEQDEIIRAEMAGVLVVQGGPGTGKTVVALHRAAYLLYTYRFPLEGQGVLVVGPNRLFLGYIEQVLPSLGEAGVELAVLADLIDGVRVQGRDTGMTARVKGDLRMASVLRRALRDRQRALRSDLVVGFGLINLRMTVDESAHIVSEARRRFRKHNAGRRFVEGELFRVLASSAREDLSAATVRERLRATVDVREALEWMWPMLTPAQFLHDFFGSTALLKHAGGSALRADEITALFRSRSDSIDSIMWTNDDVPLLDEARALLGPKPKSKRRPTDDHDDVRTYGHIVIDEAQDLSPMQLRVLNRRSLNGSMTIVGDIAQSTGEWAHRNWQEILDHLPDRREPRRAELTVGYRLPAPNMALASRVLRVADPDLSPPRSIREDGDPPQIIRVAPSELGPNVVAAAVDELEAVGTGNVAVIVPASMVDLVSDAFDSLGIEFGRATRHGLDAQITVVPVGLVKGLELDSSIVVEPAAIVEEEAQGLRSLYVALTRATKRLAIVHARDLPAALLD